MQHDAVAGSAQSRPIYDSAAPGALLLVGAVWAMLAGAALAFWLLLHPVPVEVFRGGEDFLRCCGPLGVSGLCFWCAWREGRGRTGADTGESIRRWVPVIVALGILGFTLGQGVGAYTELMRHGAVGEPALADAASLLSYSLLLLAFLLLPHGARWVVSRAQLVLDGLLVVVGLAALSWYFVLGPAVLAASSLTTAKVIEGACPLWDLIIIACFLLFSAVLRESALRPAGALCAAALVVLVGTDSLREYEVLHGLYRAGSLLDLGRPFGYMLLGLAAIAIRVYGPGTTPAAGRPPQLALRHVPVAVPRLWRYLLPYASVPAVVGLMIYAARVSTDPRLSAGVYIAGAILVELVFLHQFLDYRELIAIANRNARLESLAAADGVTGLPNHRTIVSALDKEFNRARRYEHPCAVLFLDLDHFKALNDSYGHPAGDAALREFSSVVRSALRDFDMLGRWGGEEFLAILPHTDLEDAVAVGERVRAMVASHTFWSAGGVHLTCSIGVAAFPHDANTRDTLVETADRAMYAAKRLGRNQVRTASDPAIAILSSETLPGSAREGAALQGTVEALAALVEARDDITGQHVQAVSSLSTRLALELGLDTSDAFLAGLAGKLHDIGKIAIPDAVLNKPARLTEHEWSIVRRHAAVGASVVSRVPKLNVLAAAIRAHHERWDGTGYPDGLAGEAIPLSARILAVSDAYHAMVSERPYRPAMSAAMAIEELEACAGTQFDPAVVDAFKRVLQHPAAEGAA